jgi:integrase
MRDSIHGRGGDAGNRRRVPYLVRLGRGYAFRRRYPHDIRPYVDGEFFFKRLQAVDFEQVKREVHEATEQFNGFVDSVRAQHGLQRAYRLRTEDAAALAARVPAIVLANDEADRRRGIDRSELQRYRQCVARHARAATDAALRHDTAAVEPLAQLLLAQENIRACAGSAAYDELLRQLLLAQQHALTLLSQRLLGQPVPTPPLPEAPGGPGDYDLFERALQHWAAARSPRPKTLHEARVAFKRLRDFAGTDRIGALDGRTIAGFRAHLVSRFKLKGASVRKLLALLRAVFAQLVSDRLIASNPLEGIRAPRAVDSRQVLPFCVEQLQAIFNSAVYTLRLRPKRAGGEAAFWLPLLALFSGARLEELGQLKVADIVTVDGVVALRLCGGEGQSIKNRESERHVPVHDTLRRIGFDRFVQWQRSRGQTWLFPELRPDRMGVRTSGFSRWFARYLDDTVGIADPSYTFHSLRHTFKAYGRRCRLDAYLLDALQGHAPSTVGGTYGGKPPVSELAAAMRALVYEGLDLAHVCWVEPTGDEPRRLPRTCASADARRGASHG